MYVYWLFQATRSSMGGAFNAKATDAQQESHRFEDKVNTSTVY